jgi:hypothetical protein
LGPSAINKPLVPAPGHYDDGQINGTTDWLGKLKYTEKTYPSATLSTTKPTLLPGREPGPPRWEASDQQLDL